jgi:hypothetical protein
MTDTRKEAAAALADYRDFVESLKAGPVFIGQANAGFEAANRAEAALVKAGRGEADTPLEPDHPLMVLLNAHPPQPVNFIDPPEGMLGRMAKIDPVANPEWRDWHVQHLAELEAAVKRKKPRHA